MRSRLVTLIGLDFGSTTCSAVVAEARLTEHCATGRRELEQAVTRYRSTLVMTPFVGQTEDVLDLEAVDQLIEGWLRAAEVKPDELFGGGALITGLAAGTANATQLTALLRKRLQDAVIATASDPCLESFVAFMRSCAKASGKEPQTPFLNLDIGGGTTNLALGMNGEVLRTGCLQIGARHLRFAPGTLRLTGASPLGRRQLQYLGIAKELGETLRLAEIECLLDYYVTLLHSACTGQRSELQTALGQQIEQVELRIPEGLPPPKLAFSGGVGALIHARLAGDTQPPSTCYGDLGPHLAERIVRSPLLHGEIVQSEHAGRATVYGLLEHATVISGSTLFVSRPELLPLRDLPILGSISSQSSPIALHDALLLLRRSPGGGALRVRLFTAGLHELRTLGVRLQESIRALHFPPTHPIVLLLAENLGKVLGAYVTGFSALNINLLVLDEISVRSARFVQLGRLQDQVIPVSFYGLLP